LNQDELPKFMEDKLIHYILPKKKILIII